MISSSKQFSSKLDNKLITNYSNYERLNYLKENLKDKKALNYKTKELISFTNPVNNTPNQQNSLRNSIFNFINFSINSNSKDINNKPNNKNKTEIIPSYDVKFDLSSNKKTNNNISKNKSKADWKNYKIINNNDLCNEKNFKNSFININNNKDKKGNNYKNPLNNVSNFNNFDNNYNYNLIIDKNDNLNLFSKKENVFSNDNLNNNFNLNDYSESNLNSYKVERKNIFKSHMGKNRDLNYMKKQQKINIINQNDKNPLVNSLTIQKLNTPPKNKNSNTNLNFKLISNIENHRQLFNGSIRFFDSNSGIDYKDSNHILNKNPFHNHKTVINYSSKEINGFVYKKKQNEVIINEGKNMEFLNKKFEEEQTIEDNISETSNINENKNNFVKHELEPLEIREK